MDEIGKRFIEITNKLNDIGVFYGKNMLVARGLICLNF